MNKLIKIITTVLLIVVMAGIFFEQSCTHEPIIIPIDNPNDTVISYQCNPDTVYFQNEILPVLISNCAFSGCHDAITFKEEINLESFQSLQSSRIVKAGNPASSKLYKKIIETNPEDRMPPPPYDIMSSNQVAKIKKWIEQGALNNKCDAACDTTNVTYSITITGLISTYCIGCHRSSNPGGNVILENYTQIAALGNNGKLMGAVNHDVGFIAMPYKSQKLSTCKISQFKIWIDNGTPNN